MRSATLFALFLCFHTALCLPPQSPDPLPSTCEEITDCLTCLASQFAQELGCVVCRGTDVGEPICVSGVANCLGNATRSSFGASCPSTGFLDESSLAASSTVDCAFNQAVVNGTETITVPPSTPDFYIGAPDNMVELRYQRLVIDNVGQVSNCSEAHNATVHLVASSLHIESELILTSCGTLRISVPPNGAVNIMGTIRARHPQASIVISADDADITVDGGMVYAPTVAVSARTVNVIRSPCAFSAEATSNRLCSIFGDVEEFAAGAGVGAGGDLELGAGVPAVNPIVIPEVGEQPRHGCASLSPRGPTDNLYYVMADKWTPALESPVPEYNVSRGGGSIVIAASVSLVLTEGSAIVASGGYGHPGTFENPGVSGGGGGSIIIRTPSIEADGTPSFVYARGGDVLTGPEGIVQDSFNLFSNSAGDYFGGVSLFAADYDNEYRAATSIIGPASYVPEFATPSTNVGAGGGGGLIVFDGLATSVAAPGSFMLKAPALSSSLDALIVGAEGGLGPSMQRVFDPVDTVDKLDVYVDGGWTPLEFVGDAVNLNGDKFCLLNGAGMPGAIMVHSDDGTLDVHVRQFPDATVTPATAVETWTSRGLCMFHHQLRASCDGCDDGRISDGAVGSFLLAALDSQVDVRFFGDLPIAYSICGTGTIVDLGVPASSALGCATVLDDDSAVVTPGLMNLTVLGSSDRAFPTLQRLFGRDVSLTISSFGDEDVQITGNVYSGMRERAVDVERSLSIVVDSTNGAADLLITGGQDRVPTPPFTTAKATAANFGLTGIRVENAVGSVLLGGPSTVDGQLSPPVWLGSRQLSIVSLGTVHFGLNLGTKNATNLSLYRSPYTANNITSLVDRSVVGKHGEAAQWAFAPVASISARRVLFGAPLSLTTVFSRIDPNAFLTFTVSRLTVQATEAVVVGNAFVITASGTGLPAGQACPTCSSDSAVHFYGAHTALPCNAMNVTTFDDPLRPSLPGGGGSRQSSGSSTSRDSADEAWGGGVVHLLLPDRRAEGRSSMLAIFGRIEANGQKASNSEAAGAGGSVLLEANIITSRKGAMDPPTRNDQFNDPSLLLSIVDAWSAHKSQLSVPDKFNHAEGAGGAVAVTAFTPRALCAGNTLLGVRLAPPNQYNCDSTFTLAVNGAVVPLQSLQHSLRSMDGEPNFFDLCDMTAPESNFFGHPDDLVGSGSIVDTPCNTTFSTWLLDRSVDLRYEFRAVERDGLRGVRLRPSPLQQDGVSTVPSTSLKVSMCGSPVRDPDAAFDMDTTTANMQQYLNDKVDRDVIFGSGSLGAGNAVLHMQTQIQQRCGLDTQDCESKFPVRSFSRYGLEFCSDPDLYDENVVFRGSSFQIPVLDYSGVEDLVFTRPMLSRVAGGNRLVIRMLPAVSSTEASDDAGLPEEFTGLSGPFEELAWVWDAADDTSCGPLREGGPAAQCRTVPSVPGNLTGASAPPVCGDCVPGSLARRLYDDRDKRTLRLQFRSVFTYFEAIPTMDTAGRDAGVFDVVDLGAACRACTDTEPEEDGLDPPVTCPGGRDMPVIGEGYWASQFTGPYLRCEQEEYCPGGNLSSCSTELNRAGSVCMGCEGGFYRVVDKCEACPNPRFKTFLIFVLLFFFLGVFFLLFGNKIPGKELLFSQIDFFQHLSLMFAMKIDWSPAVLDLFRNISFFSLSFDGAGPECMSADFASVPVQTAIYLATPIVFFVAAMVIRTFCYCVGRLRRGLVAAYFQFFMLFYIVISSKAFTPLDCTVREVGLLEGEQASTTLLDVFDGNAVATLDADPNIPCDPAESDYLVLLIAGIMGIIVYVICCPLCLFCKLKRGNLESKGFRRVWGFMYMPFRWQDNRFLSYWKLFVVVRKAFLVTAILFLSANRVAQIVVTGIVLVVALSLQVIYKPFAVKQAVMLETVNMSSALGVLVTGLTLEGTAQTVIVTVIFAISMTLFVFFFGTVIRDYRAGKFKDTTMEDESERAIEADVSLRELALGHGSAPSSTRGSRLSTTGPVVASDAAVAEANAAETVQAVDGSEAYQCEQCPKAFSERLLLAKHITRIHEIPDEVDEEGDRLLALARLGK